MLTPLQRIRAIDASLTLQDSHQMALEQLQGLEYDLPVYRRLGTPVWKIEDVKKEIARIRAWIESEMIAKHI